MTDNRYPRKNNNQTTGRQMEGGRRTPRLLMSTTVSDTISHTGLFRRRTDVGPKHDTTHSEKANILPEYAAQEGVTHINISNRSNTELGRLLVHYTHSPFVHPHYGPFNSMEGLWHYIKTSPEIKERDKLRTFAGHRAKELGKNFPKRQISNFREQILEANFFKIEQNPRLLELMKASTLPFDHYYLHGEGNVLIRPDGLIWLSEGFEEIRSMLKEGRRPKKVNYNP